MNSGTVLQPLSRIHLYPDGDTSETDKVSRLYIYGFIGLFIILIACINFGELQTARTRAPSRTRSRYRFNRYIGVEAGFVDMGNPVVDLQDPADPKNNNVDERFRAGRRSRY